MSKQEELKIEVPVEDRVPVKGKLSYAIGFAAKDCVQVVINSYIMVYLMEVVGLNFAYIGTLMLATRIFDAINDPIIGQYVDHRKSKNGRYRPVIRLGSTALAIVFLCLMWVPEFQGMGKYVWATLFYVGWSVCFTFVEVPYFGILPAMTPSPHERGVVTSWSRIASRVPSIAIPLVIGALTNALGNRNGYASIGVIVAIIVILGGFIAFKGCEERALANPDNAGKASIASFLKVLKGNLPLLFLMLVQFSFTFNTVLGDMLNVQYISYYLGKPELSSYLIAPVNAGLILGQILVPQFQKITGGGKKSVQIGFVCYIVMLVITFLAGKTTIPIWVAAMFVLNMFCGAIQIMVIMLCFDNADYIEYNTGERADATIFAIVSFLMKLGAGSAASIAAFALGFAGFSMMGPGEGANIEALSFIRYIVPIICVALAFIMLLCYRIKDSEMLEIRKELKRRRDAEHAAAEQ